MRKKLAELRSFASQLGKELLEMLMLLVGLLEIIGIGVTSHNISRHIRR